MFEQPCSCSNNFPVFEQPFSCSNNRFRVRTVFAMFEHLCTLCFCTRAVNHAMFEQPFSCSNNFLVFEQCSGRRCMISFTGNDLEILLSRDGGPTPNIDLVRRETGTIFRRKSLAGIPWGPFWAPLRAPLGLYGALPGRIWSQRRTSTRPSRAPRGPIRRPQRYHTNGSWYDIVGRPFRPLSGTLVGPLLKLRWGCLGPSRAVHGA